MKKKHWAARMLSGVLSAVMTLSVAAAPIAAWADDSTSREKLEEYVASLPELEDVRDRLDKDEIVSAKDYEIEFGKEIDLKTDFTNIRIPDEKKIKVTFYEAKNADQKAFSSTGQTPTRPSTMQSLQTQTTLPTASTAISL